MELRAKEIGVSSVVSFCASLAVLVPAANYVLAAEITARVSPLIESQKILLSQIIADYEDSVVAIEYKKDTCGVPGCWTAEDARTQTRLVNKISTTRDALRKLSP